MPTYHRMFVQDEDGAVTVDWVVLTAMIVGFQVVLLLTPLREALVNLTVSIANTVSQSEETLRP